MKFSILPGIFSLIIFTCFTQGNFAMEAEQDTIVGGYLPHYRMSIVEAEVFDYLTHLYYFSLSTDTLGELGQISSSGEFIYLEDRPSVTADINKLIQLRGEKDVKIYVVLGGWSGSVNFAEAVSKPSSRANLVGNITDFCQEHGLDGLDLDWETYKGEEQQINYGLLIDELSIAFEETDMDLSMAINPTRTYMIDKISNIDFIQLMSYGRTISEGTQVPMSTLRSWVDGWVNAGFSKAKLVIGIPVFGKTTADNSSIHYKKIVELFDPLPSADMCVYDGKPYYYNGINTVTEKSQYALDEELRGVMTWEVGQDLPPGDEKSLQKHIYQTIFKPVSTSLEMLDSKLKVYPNPAKDELHIEFGSGQNTDVSIQVYDLSGRMYIDFRTGHDPGSRTSAIYTGNLSPGTYILVCSGNDVSYHGKFIIE